MKLNRLLVGLVAGGMMMGAATAAQAAPFFAEYAGTITVNHGASPAVWGTSDLAGLGFVVTFEYDPTLGTRYNSPSVPGPDGTFTSLIQAFSGANPLRSVNMRINGVDLKIDTSTSGGFQTDIGGFHNGTVGANDYSTLSFTGSEFGPGTFGGNPINEYVFFNANAGGRGDALPFDLSSWNPTTEILGNIQMQGGAGLGPITTYVYNWVGAVTSVRVFAEQEQLAGVPAPGALMLVGLGLIGLGAARRRR